MPPRLTRPFAFFDHTPDAATTYAPFAFFDHTATTYTSRNYFAPTWHSCYVTL